MIPYLCGTARWSPDELESLKVGLKRYPAHEFTAATRYVKIASSLPSKTVRDVASKARQLVVEEQNAAPQPTPTGVPASCRTEDRQLTEVLRDNVRVIDDMRANILSAKTDANVDLMIAFCSNLKRATDVLDGMPVSLPPLNVRLDVRHIPSDRLPAMPASIAVTAAAPPVETGAAPAAAAADALLPAGSAAAETETVRSAAVAASAEEPTATAAGAGGSAAVATQQAPLPPPTATATASASAPASAAPTALPAAGESGALAEAAGHEEPPAAVAHTTDSGVGDEDALRVAVHEAVEAAVSDPFSIKLLVQLSQAGDGNPDAKRARIAPGNVPDVAVAAAELVVPLRPLLPSAASHQGVLAAMTSCLSQLRSNAERGSTEGWTPQQLAVLQHHTRLQSELEVLTAALAAGTARPPASTNPQPQVTTESSPVRATRRSGRRRTPRKEV